MLLQSQQFTHVDQETGGSKYPVKRELILNHPDFGKMGAIKYYPPKKVNGPLAIDNVSVEQDHMRKGVASSLMDEVQKRHPSSEIKHGDRTSAGKLWWEGYTRGKRVKKGRTL